MARAQDEPVIEEMYVLIWPEYLNTDVVVNQVAVFVNNTERIFQGRIEFLLPKGANPLGLSVMLEDVYSRYYEVVTDENHQIVRYDMLEPLSPGGKLPLMVEYSYPLQVKGGLRDIEIEISSKYPVGVLGVGVQKPSRVTDFNLNPSTDTKITDREGFDVYQYNYTDVKPNENLKFAFTYSKEDSLPSVDPEPVPNVHSVEEEERQGLSSSTVIIILIAFLLMMALVLLLSRTMSQNKANQSKKGSAKGTKGKK